MFCKTDSGRFKNTLQYTFISAINLRKKMNNDFSYLYFFAHLPKFCIYFKILHREQRVINNKKKSVIWGVS